MATLEEQFTTAMRSNVRETSAKVLLAITDDVAKANITDVLTATTPETSIKGITAGIPEVFNNKRFVSHKFATSETDYLLLNGSFVVPQEEPNGFATTYDTELGYWSDEICGSDGTFVSDPTIKLEFYDAHVVDVNPDADLTFITSDSIAVCFDDALEEYAEEFTVNAYKYWFDGIDSVVEDLVDTVSVTGNTEAKVNIPGDWDGFNELEVIVTKWCKGYRRARICEIDVGYIFQYEDENIEDVNIIEEIDLNSMTLPYNQLDFSVVDENKLFHPLNTSGIAQYLTVGQKVDVQLGVRTLNDEFVYKNAGTFYLTGWDSNNLSASFTAQDLFSLNTSNKYDKQDVGTTDIATVLTDVLSYYGIDSYTTDGSFTTSTACGGYWPLSTLRESLRLIAQAGMGVLFVNRDNEVYIADVGDDANSIDLDNMANFPKVTQEKQIKDIIVNYYQFAEGATTETIFDETGDFGTPEKLEKVVFNGPYSSVIVSWTDDNPLEPSQVDETIFTNAVYLDITPYSEISGVVPGTLTITGKPVIITKKQTTISVSEKGETIEIDNPLITTLTHATAVGNWIKSNYEKLNIIDVNWQQDPDITLNNVLSVETEFGTETSHIVTKNELNYAGYLSGSTSTKGGS